MTPTGRTRLIADEGLRLRAYDDATGQPIMAGLLTGIQPGV